MPSTANSVPCARLCGLFVVEGCVSMCAVPCLHRTLTVLTRRPQVVLPNHHVKRSSPPLIVILNSSAHTTHYDTGHASHHDMPMDPIQKKVAELSIVTSGTPMADRGVIHPGIVNIRGKEDSKARKQGRQTGMEAGLDEACARGARELGWEGREGMTEGKRLECEVAAASWSRHMGVPRGGRRESTLVDRHRAYNQRKARSTHLPPSLIHAYIHIPPVLAAKGIKSLEILGKPDTYVVVRYGGEEHRTKEVDDCEDPIYEDDWVSTVGMAVNEFVEVSIMEKYNVQDKELGSLRCT